MSLTAPRLKNKNVLSGVSFQLTVDTLPNVYFSKMSELKLSKEPGEYVDGSTNYTRNTDDGVIKVEPTTLELPYDPDTAKIIGDWVALYLDGQDTDLTVRPVRVSANGDVTPLSVAYHLGNCRLSEFVPFTEIDRGSKDVVMTKLTFTVEYFTIR